MRARHVLFVLFLSTAATQATTYIKLTFDGLCDRTELVFAGTVALVEYARNPENQNIYTFTTFEDIHWIHPGDPSDQRDTYTLRLLGGTAGGETLIVHGMPRFEIGSEYVVFVRGNNHYVCPVVGGRQGCFRILQDDGQRRVVTYDNRPVVGVEAGDIVVPTNPPQAERRNADRASISLDTFIAEIEAGLRRAADSRSSAETEER